MRVSTQLPWLLAPHVGRRAEIGITTSARELHVRYEKRGFVRVDLYQHVFRAMRRRSRLRLGSSFGLGERWPRQEGQTGCA
jgi:hypothetical protein